MKFPSWIAYVARRYFLSKRKERGVASSVLSVAGLALGTATLIVVIGVMNGFQSGFIRSIIEISSYHVRLEPEEGRAAELLEAMRRDPRVLAAIEFRDLQVLAKSTFGEPEGMNLRAMSADALLEDKGLREALGLSEKDARALEKGELIIGNQMADAFAISPGDGLEIVSIAIDGQEGLTPISRVLTVQGSFTSAFYDYDRSWALCSLETAAMLETDAGAETTVGVKLRTAGTEGAFASSIAADMPDSVREAVSWKEYNRVFFGALRTEKTILMLVICLIPIVVAANIFHSLRRSVFERHEEIGLMRAMGAGPRDIQGIFILEGSIIGLMGASIGLLLGLAIALNVNGIFAFAEDAVNLALAAIRAIVAPLTSEGSGFSIFSPAYFYLTEVPVRVYFPETLFSFLFACLAGGVSAFFASRAVSRFHPQEILRYE